MAKKSTAARHSNAARRSQTTAKAQHVTLVRDRAETGGATTTTTTTPAREAPRVAPPARVEKPAARPVAKAPAPKPAARPVPAPAKSYTARQQEARVARARETRRVRTAGMVTPEHYLYVVKDLRLTAILATAMFAIIIVLHFVLS